MARPSRGVVVVEASRACNAVNGVDVAGLVHGEDEVVGDEVFRTPRWSAGLLHLHFSVARGNLVGKNRRQGYDQGK